MNNLLRIVVASVILSTSLSGCFLFRNNTVANDMGDACRMSYKSVGGWKIAGLEIPLGKLAPDQKVKIGSVEYGATQVDKLAETAQLLEQVRLMNCAVLSAKLPDAAELVKKAYDVVQAFGTGLKTATTPQQGMAAADKAQSEAKQLAENTMTKPGAPEAPAGPQPPSTPKTSSNDGESDVSDPFKAIAKLAASTSRDSIFHGERIKAIQDTLTSLNKRVDNMRPLPQQSAIEIVGFAFNGTSIPADAREGVYEKFGAALDAIPEGVTAKVLIVGYTDKSGAYLRNLDLGLRRAEVIREILQRQSYARAFLSQAVSGGVSESQRGRHVMIYVSV